MCPTTLAIVGAVAGAGQAVLGGLSSAGQANYQAQVAANNATIARQNAGYTAGAGASQIEEAGLKARSQQGEVRAGLAANNLDVNSGSPDVVQQSQRVVGALDTANVANRAAQGVYGYETQATNYDAQSKLYGSEVGPDILGGFLGAAGKIAGAAPDFPSTAGGPSSLPSGYSWMMNPELPSSVDEEFAAGLTPASSIPATATPLPF